jgi:dTDP-4-dehydrorhamnose reductase
MTSSTSVTGSSSPVTGKLSRLLLVGGNGMLAKKVATVAPAGYEITAVDLPDFDMTDRDRVLAYVEDLQPEVIVNCAAFTNVDGCETEQALAEQVNGVAVGYLAEASKKVDAVLVHISTDYVFDGDKNSPYMEEDLTNPQSVYGHSKLLGEETLLASGLKKYFIVRTSWLYGPGGNNFVETIIRLTKERAELGVVADQVGSPTYTGDLADAVFSLLKAATSRQPPTPSPYGLYHFSNDGQCSWYEFSKEIVSIARTKGEQLKVEKINPIKTEDYPLPAKRPKYSLFSKVKYSQVTGKLVPNWKESLTKYFAER